MKQDLVERWLSDLSLQKHKRLGGKSIAIKSACSRDCNTLVNSRIGLGIMINLGRNLITKVQLIMLTRLRASPRKTKGMSILTFPEL